MKSLYILIGFLVGTSTLGAERYVATNGLSVSPYTSWANAATNIQDAVNACSDNDVVWVTNGTYYCWSNSATAGLTSMVTIIKSITVQSMNGPEVTIVDGNYPAFTNRCFYITSNATVSGFTITNGHVSDVASGGGVYIETSGRVSNCWITGNSTTNDGGVSDNLNGGSGIRCKGGGEVVNCIIYANISTNGGYGSCGVYAYGLGTYVIRDCIISNNYNGGAAAYYVSSISISNCTFINNNGVGLLLGPDSSSGGRWTMDNCRIIGNMGVGLWTIAGYGITRNCQIINNTGGGVDLALYVLTNLLSNCVVSSNYSVNSGAGIVMAGNSTLVQDCTIISNIVGSAGSGGGGVRITSGTLRNCLIANNDATYGGGLWLTVAAGYTGQVENCTIVSNSGSASFSGIYTDSSTATGMLVNTICYFNSSVNNWGGGGNLAAYNCCITPTNGTGFSGTGNITNPPDFLDSSAGNFRLNPGSPCVNAGINQDWMQNAVDLDGYHRINRYYGNIVDIGAYEYIPALTIYSVH